MHYPNEQTYGIFNRLTMMLLGLLFLQSLLWSPLSKAMDAKVDRQVNTDRDLQTSIRLGELVFQSKCEKCHGEGGKGTSSAPNLVHSADRLAPQQFSNRVLKGHVIILGYSDAAGDDRTAVREAFVELLKKRENSGVVMPSWDDNPVVRSHILELYHYLKNLGTTPQPPSGSDTEKPTP